MDTTSLAVRSGVPNLHYSFGHFRYSQLKPILRIRKSQKKSRAPPPSSAIFISKKVIVFLRGWRQKITQ